MPPPWRAPPLARVSASCRNSLFTCRKAAQSDPFLRELVISFGASGYVALFEIEDNAIVTILAIRHQREDDYL